MEKGENKINIVKELSSSEEAKKYGFHLNGLKDVIENSIKYHELYVDKIEDIIKKDELFIECCFINFLGRELDDDSKKFFEKIYEKCHDKEYVMNKIRMSEEGILFNRDI